MRFGTVEIPDELVAAARGDEFVLFVGAGASVGSPSCLPTFDRLTKLIAEDALTSFEDGDSRGFDAKLASLEDLYGVDVHARVAFHIDQPGSEPNDLHKSIAKLAASSPKLRIVTTNYDHHLSAALKDVLGHDVQEYVAPALPVGDDFEGVVYLHGKLGQDPRHLIATDIDFGRAYLTDAWAARFLQRMFGKYTALFIGYSHEDVVMSYLARGLRPGKDRYAISPSGSGQNWRRLGIKELSYKQVSGSHSELDTCLSAWASHAEMSLLSHRSQTEKLIVHGEPWNDQELSYLRSVFANSDTTGSFVEFARGAEWLQWATVQPEFAALFAPGADDPQSWLLASWFVNEFVNHEEHSEAAMRVVLNHGGRVGPLLAQVLGQGIANGVRPRPVHLNAWLIMLLSEPRSATRHWLQYALLASKEPQHAATALVLFDHLTEPEALFEIHSGMSYSTPVDIGVPSDGWDINEAWESILQPMLPEVAPQLLSIAERHFRRAKDLAAAVGLDTGEWDGLSRRRASIAEHFQNGDQEPIDVLIDAARDSLAAIGATDRPSLLALVDRWLSSGSRLLMRLAVYGYDNFSNASADDRIRWVLERNLLKEDALHREVNDLLVHAISAASDEGVHSMLSWIDAFVWSDDQRRNQHAKLNKVGWLSQHAPENTEIATALSQLRAQLPSLLPGTPSLPGGIGGLVGLSGVGRWRMEPGELAQALEQDATAAVAALLALPDGDWLVERPNREAGYLALRTLIVADASVGTQVLNAVSDPPIELQQEVVSGWAAAELSEEIEEQVLGWALGADIAKLAPGLAKLLDQGTSRSDETMCKSALARRLATSVLESLPEVEFEESEDSVLHVATGSTVSGLVRFWVRCMLDDHMQRPTGAAPEMSQEGRVALEGLMTAPAQSGAFAEITVGTHLDCLYFCDPAWTTSWVMPLLIKPGPLPLALHGWILGGAAVTPSLLSAGLLEGYLGALGREQQLGAQLRSALINRLAVAAILPEPSPASWSMRLVVSSSPQFRMAWLEQLYYLLRNEGMEKASGTWASWLRAHFQRRAAGLPRPPSPGEVGAMCQFVPLLKPEYAAEAVELCVSQPAMLLKGSRLLVDLSNDLIEASPEIYGRLVLHVLKGSAQEFGRLHNLQVLRGRLLQLTSPVLRDALAEEFLRLGVH